MLVSLFYIALAALGLGVLVFIHELGHYFMARKVGMKVEAFGIGFGKAIYSWMRNDVQWRLNWIPFGGYVKIKGMELQDDVDPYTVEGGYFSKSPLDRIKVAIAGPITNLVFAFLVFVCLWAFGGREKNFSEFSTVIGWVDPTSELYAHGVRPGDIINSYDDHTYHSAKDHLTAPMTVGSILHVKGEKVNQLTHEKVPFDYVVKPYLVDSGLKSSGIFSGANYIIYNRLPNGAENPLPVDSPLQNSGIAYGDRIIWVDGEMIFSDQQLSHILNDNRALLTVSREGKILLKRVPRVLVQELKLDQALRDELTDWQYEAELNNVKIQNLFAIPYNINSDAVVEGEIKLIDKENQEKAFQKNLFSEIESPLQAKDKIIAVDGTPIKYAYQLLYQLQKKQVNIVVERDPTAISKISSKVSNAEFNKEISSEDLQQIGNSIGTDRVVSDLGILHLLKPVTPKMRKDFVRSQEDQAKMNAELAEQKKEIEAIEDREKRARIMALLESRDKQLILGIPYQDRKVEYNPTPVELFYSVFDEIWHTLVALFSGYMNPKWLSGPIGIVQVVHQSWMVSLKEALFWLGAISLNLGILNLLPIPALDGGYICLSIFEMVTRRRIKPKTIEKLVLPFAILIIGFLIYLTYNDLLRISGHFFG